MGFVNYDITTSPSPPKAEFSVTADPKSVTITLAKLDCDVTVNPTTGTIVGGVITGAILGSFVGAGLTVGAIYAIAAILKDKVKGALDDAVSKVEPITVDLAGGSPIGYGFQVAGVEVQATASTLELGTFQGMLMASGTVTVS